MYLEYFDFVEFPFVLTPNTYYFCNLPSYREALNVLLLSLRSGEGFIKIVGEVGTGKTMLCRELLNTLGDEYVTAYVANPFLDYKGLLKTLARELEIAFPLRISQDSLLSLLNERLLFLHNQGKKVAIIVDEAQVLSDQSLEGLRLLSNLETESAKLLQIVLFGQTELDARLNSPHLRQLKQRIAFSHYLQPVNRIELENYVNHRLTKAGSKYNAIFTKRAFDLLFRASKGIPRLINILCHKALIASYGRGKRMVDGKSMHLAIRDTASVHLQLQYRHLLMTLLLVAVVILSAEVIAVLRFYL